MYDEELEILKVLSEYIDKKGINHIYIKHYPRLKQMLIQYHPFLIFSDSGLRINIKNINRNDIVINYLDNLKEIRAKKVYFIQGENLENPLIMFKWNSKYLIKKKKIKQKFRKHSSTKYVYQIITPIQNESNLPKYLFINLIRAFSNKIKALTHLVT